MAQQSINIGTSNNSGNGEGLRSAFDKCNDNFSELYVKNYGFFDYNDLSTATTPISITGGAGFTYLTNDELGSFTNKTYPPTGVTDVWDASNNRFDFGELILGSEMRYRIDLEYTTLSANQEVELAIELAIGGTPYTLNVSSDYYKTAGTHQLTIYNSVYMGDTNTLNNYAKFKVQSANNVDVQVNGWACFIHLY